MQTYLFEKILTSFLMAIFVFCQITIIFEVKKNCVALDATSNPPEKDITRTALQSLLLSALAEPS